MYSQFDHVHIDYFDLRFKVEFRRRGGNGQQIMLNQVRSYQNWNTLCTEDPLKPFRGISHHSGHRFDALQITNPRSL